MVMSRTQPIWSQTLLRWSTSSKTFGSIQTRLRSAPTASSRGRMVSSASSSALSMITSPGWLRLIAPRVVVAAASHAVHSELGLTHLAGDGGDLAERHVREPQPPDRPRLYGARPHYRWASVKRSSSTLPGDQASVSRLASPRHVPVAVTHASETSQVSSEETALNAARAAHPDHGRTAR
jgi:hypothetical protein